MSSEGPGQRTVVPGGITNEVELARAELKATLAAIEYKGNIPARAGEAIERKADAAKSFASRKPAAAIAVAVGVAAAVGAAIWGVASLLSRK